MNNDKQLIKIKKPDSKSEYVIKSLCLDKLEIAISELAGINLYDIIHGYDLSKINAVPVKCIKIGNGGQTFNDLKSIFILDNADFIIVDKDGNIIDYITNSNPCDIATIMMN